MDNNFNLSPSQVDGLLNLAGKKMGINPEKLKQQTQDGQAQTLINALPKEKQAKLNELLQNPEALKSLIANPQMQQLLKNLMK